MEQTTLHRDPAHAHALGGVHSQSFHGLRYPDPQHQLWQQDQLLLQYLTGAHPTAGGQHSPLPLHDGATPALTAALTPATTAGALTPLASLFGHSADGTPPDGQVHQPHHLRERIASLEARVPQPAVVYTVQQHQDYDIKFHPPIDGDALLGPVAASASPSLAAPAATATTLQAPPAPSQPPASQGQVAQAVGADPATTLGQLFSHLDMTPPIAMLEGTPLPHQHHHHHHHHHHHGATVAAQAQVQARAQAQVQADTATSALNQALLMPVSTVGSGPVALPCGGASASQTTDGPLRRSVSLGSDVAHRHRHAHAPHPQQTLNAALKNVTQQAMAAATTAPSLLSRSIVEAGLALAGASLSSALSLPSATLPTLTPVSTAPVSFGGASAGSALFTGSSVSPAAGQSTSSHGGPMVPIKASMHSSPPLTPLSMRMTQTPVTIAHSQGYSHGHAAQHAAHGMFLVPPDMMYGTAPSPTPTPTQATSPALSAISGFSHSPTSAYPPATCEGATRCGGHLQTASALLASTMPSHMPSLSLMPTISTNADALDLSMFQFPNAVSPSQQNVTFTVTPAAGEAPVLAPSTGPPPSAAAAAVARNKNATIATSLLLLPPGAIDFMTPEQAEATVEALNLATPRVASAVARKSKRDRRRAATSPTGGHVAGGRGSGHASVAAATTTGATTTGATAVACHAAIKSEASQDQTSAADASLVPSAASAAEETPRVRRGRPATKDPDQCYPCPECGHEFSRRYNLRQHMQIHTETRAREHNCTHCPRTYFRLADLQRHLRTHTTGPRFVCPGCARGFRRGDALRRHVVRCRGAGLLSSVAAPHAGMPPLVRSASMGFAHHEHAHPHAHHAAVLAGAGAGGLDHPAFHDLAYAMARPASAMAFSSTSRASVSSGSSETGDDDELGDGSGSGSGSGFGILSHSLSTSSRRTT